MSKYGTKYQGKYIKSGNTYTVDLEQITNFSGHYATVEADKTGIFNNGSTSVVDNGTDFDVTGAVAFSFDPSNDVAIGDRFKITCDITGLSAFTNNITCFIKSSSSGGIDVTDRDIQFLDHNQTNTTDGYTFYITGTVADAVAYLWFEVTGAPDFNIKNIVVSENAIEPIITISALMPDPVIVKQRGTDKDNSNEIIIGSELEFNFYSKVEDVGQFDQIFNSGFKDWRISHYRGSTLIWQGYVLPENFGRDFVNDQYEINLSATDGLGTMNDIPYLAPYLDTAGFTVEYRDRVSFIKTIKRVFDLMGIPLDFKVQMNIFENDEMGANDNALNEADHLSTRFTKTTNGRIENDSCEIVLKKVLTQWGCTLLQAEGNWWILSKIETNSPLFTYTHGVLTESRDASNNLILDISNYKFKNRGWEEVVSPIVSHEVTYFDRTLGTEPIIDGDFPAKTNWVWNGLSWTVGEDFAGGFASLVTTSPPDYLESLSNFTLTKGNGVNKFTVSFQIRLDSVVTDDQLFAPAFEMRLFKNSVEVVADDPGSTFLSKDNDWIGYSNTFQIASTGSDYKIRLYTNDGISSYTTATVLLRQVESEFDNGEGTQDKVHNTINTDSLADKSTKSDLFIGDARDPTDIGAIKFGGNPSSSWKRFGKTETLSIMNVIGLNKIVDRATYKKYVNVIAMDTSDLIRPYHKIQIIEPQIIFPVETVVDDGAGFALVTIDGGEEEGLAIGDNITLSTDDATYITVSGTITETRGTEIVTDITYTSDAGVGTLTRSRIVVYRIKSYNKNYYNWETRLTLEEILTTDPVNTLQQIPLTTSDGS